MRNGLGKENNDRKDRMGRLHHQPCGNAVYVRFRIITMTIGICRYSENPFVYGFFKGCYADAGFDFIEWWNPKRFDWTYSKYLARYCSRYFEQWWDPKKYNWQSSSALSRHCRQYFHIWWNPKRFDWKPRSTRFLMNYCKEHFDIWWDTECFPWKTNVIYLIKDFNERFETWWDEEKFPWGTEFGDVNVEEMLMEYCVDYFPIWYGTKHFQLTDRLCDLLRVRCADFKDIWAQDYLLYKLGK
ncbi:MAG: hypothetical protein JRJ38_05480 [Deltaproteobacteria bacterium]|nr:hypothetical protein [Deltaproteobacteria bacterium]